MYQSPYKPTPISTLSNTFVRWLRLKKYRVEVTYGVYVYTPMEKAMFWTVFCSLFFFISTAILLYTQRSLTLLLRAIISDLSGGGGDGLSGSLASGFLVAKNTVLSRLTTSARQIHGADKALLQQLAGGTAKNSQVA